MTRLGLTSSRPGINDCISCELWPHILSKGRQVLDDKDISVPLKQDGVYPDIQ
jgi:hypothetical protein